MEKEMNKKVNEKLNVGEKYLNVQLVFGGQRFNFAAFKNKNKKQGSKEPDYKGNEVAIWITEKKASKKDDVGEEYI